MPSFLDKLLGRKSETAPTQGATAPAVPASPKTNFDAVYVQALDAATARDFERAIRLYDEAIAIDPSRAEPYYKRANALKEVGRLEEAVASYTRAIERNPDYAYAYCNRGAVQHRMGLLEPALSSLDRAIALEPGDAVAHNNRALVLQDAFCWDEALASYDRAVAANPTFAQAQYNRALALLSKGDYASGWRAFEWRWQNTHHLSLEKQRHSAKPLWLGEQPLAGKRLLLHAERGLGDTLQFCRYATSCAALGATVYLEVQPSLVSLLRTLDGPAGVFAIGSPLPPFDYQCPLMSLPLALKTTLDSIPAAETYLKADPADVGRWQARLGQSQQLRVGLAWSGNPNNPIDPRRTIRLADWAPQLPPEFEYYRLQKDLRDADREALAAAKPRILSFEDEQRDFANTAAFMECLDIMVTVDTSIAHLSGALGRPTWILLPFASEWRWMRDIDRTPWYPTVELYRQATPGDWQAVFRRVADELRQRSVNS